MGDFYRVRLYSTNEVERITPSGNYFINSAGELIIRRSITSFCGPKRFAQGNGNDARTYFDWAASKKFNEVREFSQVNWTGPPNSGVESGWVYSEPDCEASIVEAAAAGLRVEVVAHTYAYEINAMVDHLQAVDELCLRHENALLEVYNEPQQNGGLTLLQEILRRYTPKTPGWSSGWYTPTPYPAGPSLTYHSPRDNEWSRKFKDAYEFFTGVGPEQQFSPAYMGPVMLDEPPRVEETAVADDWEAYGAGCAFFGAGGTMHGMPDMQQCIIPTRTDVLACIDAFHRGFDAVPIQRYHSYERGTPPSSDPGSRRYWRWGDDGARYEICVRPYSFRRV
jgi:hypothetical protein